VARVSRLFRRKDPKTGKLGKTWHCWIYEGKQRKSRSTHCHDKKAAELRARELEREAADPAGAAARRTTLQEVLELLLEDRAERARAGRRSPETVDCYRIKGGHWVRVLGVHFLVAELRAHHVDAFITRRRGEGAADTTIHKELVTLRAALRLALRRGVWKGDPFELFPVGFSPAYKPRSRALTREELPRLLAVLPPDRAARVAWIVGTSACLGESNRAGRGDVQGDQVAVHGTKRATRARVVPLACDWQRDLVRYALRHAEGSGAQLFRAWGNIRRDLALACEQAKIERVSPNDLRRTCGRWLRSEGVAPHVIGLVLGHADGRMAERVYARPQGAELGALVRGELGRRRALEDVDLVEAVRRAAELAADDVSSKDLRAALRVARAAASRVQQKGATAVERSEVSDTKRPDFPGDSVPRDRIELPTRGFSSLGETGDGASAPPRDRRVVMFLPAPRAPRAASPVQQTPARKRGAR
jgi:integrase